jgi:hypothetical protein
MKLSRVLSLANFVFVSFCFAQNEDYNYADYNDYAGEYGQQDSLYHDYAERQQTKG